MATTSRDPRFPSMTPISSAPTLACINGCGARLYGKRDFDRASSSYIATQCITLLFIPIFCLRSFRVSNAARGWYFLGREPLSILAKSFNGILLLSILFTGLGFGWVQYSATPAYQAKVQMDKARALADSGKPGQAARIYQGLAVAGADQSDNAAAAVKTLFEHVSSAPLQEAPAILSAAAEVSRKKDIVSLAEIVDSGKSLAAAKGPAEPRHGVAVLDVISKLAVDTRDIDAARFDLLKKWAAAEPANLEAIVPLAAMLLDQRQNTEARKLLEPHKAELGDGEGARVLGTIERADGNYEAAYALLRPYVKVRLDRLHESEKKVASLRKSLIDHELDELRQEHGPRDFYDRYEHASSENEKDHILGEYVIGRVSKDPALVAAEESLQREIPVVNVALELGIVMLNRAQTIKDPAARKTELEAAEQAFLAVQSQAGESEEYRLYLGEVYYWLGKQTEGRKLFDDLLASKSRSVEALLMIAVSFRSLGITDEARAFTEEAYNKAANDNDRYGAAQFRTLIQKDIDDELLWLARCDPANPHLKARLATVRGYKAFSEGREEEAAANYQKGIEAYKLLPEDASSLNAIALAYLGLFQATGDHAAYEHAIDCMQKAIALLPNDTTLMHNAASTISDASLGEIAAKDIDPRALRDVSFSTLQYLYHDKAGRDALIQRVKDHPGTPRVMSYLEKLMVMAPKQARAYALAASYDAFLHNHDAMVNLETRMTTGGVDSSDAINGVHEYLSGTKDATYTAALAASVKRSEDLAAALRPKGGPSLAMTLAEQANHMMELDIFTNACDPEKILALAQEAHRVSPSAGTAHILQRAYLFRLTKQLVKTDPAFAEMSRKYRRALGENYLIAALTLTANPLQKTILAHPDMQKAVAIQLEFVTAIDDDPSILAWALCKSSHPAEAEKIAATIRKNNYRETTQKVTLMLSPASASEILETAWVQEIMGHPDQAHTTLQSAIAQGIPIPLVP